MKIHKGDTVIVITGKDRGKKGKVLEALPMKSRIVVEGVNVRKKHIRAKRSGEKGQIIALPLPVDVSNAKFLCPKCGKAARIGYKIEGNKKYRFCKVCDQEV